MGYVPFRLCPLETSPNGTRRTRQAIDIIANAKGGKKMAPDATALRERDAVTVSRADGGLYTTHFSNLPSETFGPFDWKATVLVLRAGALLTPVEALSLVLGAAVNDRATTETG
jgi:hypothetical protein